MSAKWDQRLLSLAQFIASWSKDPSTQTGAVITTPDNLIVSTGYNGLPKGVADTEERLNNRELKYKIIVHCERNAVAVAAKRGVPLDGCTLYTWPFSSCSTCASIMIQSGITRHVAPACPADKLERWGDDLKLAIQLYEEAGVKVDIL